MTLKLTLAVAAILAAMGCAVARENPPLPADMDKVAFESVRTHLIAQLDDERYKEITPENKKAVIDALDRIDARLKKTGQMVDQDRIDIFNDQELINTITSHAEAQSRMYCEREAPLGSHRIRVTCRTIAEWMERANDGQVAMTRIEHRTNADESGMR